MVKRPRAVHDSHNSLARSIAVSLGLGLGLLIAVALIHHSLLTEIESHIEVDAPAYYFLDIDAKDVPAFRDTAKSVEPDAKLLLLGTNDQREEFRRLFERSGRGRSGSG